MTPLRPTRIRLAALVCFGCIITHGTFAQHPSKTAGSTPARLYVWFSLEIKGLGGSARLNKGFGNSTTTWSIDRRYSGAFTLARVPGRTTVNADLLKSMELMRSMGIKLSSEEEAEFRKATKQLSVEHWQMERPFGASIPITAHINDESDMVSNKESGGELGDPCKQHTTNTWKYDGRAMMPAGGLLSIDRDAGVSTLHFNLTLYDPPENLNPIKRKFDQMMEGPGCPKDGEKHLDLSDALSDIPIPDFKELLRNFELDTPLPYADEIHANTSTFTYISPTAKAVDEVPNFPNSEGEVTAVLTVKISPNPIEP